MNRWRSSRRRTGQGGQATGRGWGGAAQVCDQRGRQGQEQPAPQPQQHGEQQWGLLYQQNHRGHLPPLCPGQRDFFLRPRPQQSPWGGGGQLHDRPGTWTGRSRSRPRSPSLTMPGPGISSTSPQLQVQPGQAVSERFSPWM